jgi:hypothetical protein
VGPKLVGETDFGDQGGYSERRSVEPRGDMAIGTLHRQIEREKPIEHLARIFLLGNFGEEVQRSAAGGIGALKLYAIDRRASSFPKKLRAAHLELAEFVFRMV